LRKLDNPYFYGVRDITVKDGYIYMIPYYSFTVEIFNEISMEHYATVDDWSDNSTSPYRLQFISQYKLAVMQEADDEDSSAVGTVTLYDVGFYHNKLATSFLYDVQIPNVTDMAVGNDSDSVWVVTTDKIMLYNHLLDYTRLLLDKTNFSLSSDESFAFIEYYDGYFWLVTQTSTSSTLWKIDPTDLSRTVVQAILGFSINSFLFKDNDTIIIVGCVTDLSFYDTYSVIYRDGRIYQYRISSNSLTYLVDPDSYPLGYLTGSAWASDNSIWVADYSKVWKFNTTGDYLGELTAHRGFVAPTGLSVDPFNDTRAMVLSMNRIMPFDLASFDFVEPDLVDAVVPDSDGSDAITNSISITDDGDMWIASYKGTKVFNIEDGSFLFGFNGSISESDDVRITPNGSIWVVYQDCCAVQYDVETQTWQNYILWTATRDAISRVAATDKYVYLSSNYYLYRFSIKNLTDPDVYCQVPASWDLIVDIEIGPDNHLYVLTTGGVFRLSPELEEPKQLTDARPDSNINSAIRFVKAYCDCPSSQDCVYGACEDKKSYVAIIVGTVLGVVGLIGLIIAGVLIWKKRSHIKELIRLPEEKSKEESVPLQDNPNEPKRRMTSFDSHWEIQFKELEIGQQIGSGAFGAVFKAVYRNSDCVVKQLLKESEKDAMANFLKEAQTVIHVKPHKNVCFLFGVCTNPEYPICIVMEYVNGGSLQTLLVEEKIELNLKNIIKICKDVTSGMSHLHHEGLLHCDLACRNLLVSLEKGNEFTVKLSDFGLARFSETGTYNASVTAVFPVRWSAPEVLRGAKLSKASDVWSFGIVMWEIIQGTIPYLPMSNQEVIEYVCVKKQVLSRPTAIENLPESIWNSMQRCWAYQPNNRPTFDELYQTFKELDNELWNTENSGTEQPVSNESVSRGRQIYGNRTHSNYENFEQKVAYETPGSTQQQQHVYGNRTQSDFEDSVEQKATEVVYSTHEI